MKKHLTLFMCLLFSNFLFSQVGINTDEPNLNTLLHISEKKKITNPDSDNQLKGIIIPRLTEEDRDKLTYENPLANPKVLKLLASDNSLMIYNTTENCYNYWNYLEQEWKSLCGKLGKSEFIFNCPTDVSVFGTYIQGKELSTSNYLSIKINVTKPGDYSITATTTNGYSFYATGTFLNQGTYTVILAGQGTPTNVGINDLTIESNGIETVCSPNKQVQVLTAAGTYDIGCKEIRVNGVYKKGTALTSTNTITVPVNVTTAGSWSMHTNSVDGISFSGSGTFTGIGVQNITLNGIGTPSSILTKKMTLTHNSEGLENTGCLFDVTVVIPKKLIVHIGGTGDHGYSAYEDASRSLIDEPLNFGTSNQSLVKTEGFNHVNPKVEADIITALNTKPDIVIMGYPYLPTSNVINALINYLNAGGVVIAHLEEPSSIQNLMRSVFSDPSITADGRNGAGAVYNLINHNDDILNGVFGDIRGKNWGEDASVTVAISNIPSSMITAYTQASSINSTNIYNGVTMFKHNSLNFFYVGDGGFLSNFNSSGYITSQTAYPFATNASNFPVEKVGYGTLGNGYSAGSMSVQNSIIFANVMAWAIHQAEFYGINTK